MILPTTPATIKADLAKLQPGDTLTLGANRYPQIVVKDRDFGASPLVIDATGATLDGLVLQNVKGLTVEGGDWRTPKDDWRGAMMASKCADLTFHRSMR